MSSGSKTKVPVVRKAGEVVTPVRSRPGTVSMQVVKIPTVTPTARLTKVVPARVTMVSTVHTVRKLPEPEPELEYEPAPEYESDANVSEGSVPEITLEIIHDKLISLDYKLDQIMAKLGQHDAAFKVVKYNIKDLRTQLQNSVQHTAAITEFRAEDAPEPKRPRKRLVLLPIADEDYLQRLEQLVQTDDEVRAELSGLYLDAPNTSAYEFMRKNLYALFQNADKYTWTGRVGNAKDQVGCASKLNLVEILIDSGCEKFPNCTRESVERVCQRAMKNFNGVKYFKLPKRLKQREMAARGESYEEDPADEEII